MHLSYKNILKNAWQLTVSNKILWLFGVFASFISLEAVYEIILSQIYQAKKIEIFHLKLLTLYQSQIDYLAGQVFFLNALIKDLSSYFVFIILAVIVFFFIWLVFISQIFIIKSAAKLYKNKKLDASKDLSGSSEKFWPVLGINIITKLIIYAGYLILSLPLLYALLIQDHSAILATNLLFFVLFSVFAIVISFLTAYATNFIILNDSHIFEAYKQAWQLFSRNVTISFEIALILFLLKIISLIIILCLTFIVVVPLVLLFIIVVDTGNVLGLIMTLTLMLLFFSLISLFVNAIFTAFYLSTWTLAFIELTQDTFISKLLHLAKNIPLLFKKASKKYHVEIDKKEIKAKSKEIAKEVKAQYKKYKPVAKKQSKVAAKKLKETYNKLEPKIEKEIKKIIAQSKKKKTAVTTKRKAKKTTQKTQTAKRKTARKKTTSPKRKK